MTGNRALGSLVVRLAVELARYKADWQEAEKATADGATSIEGKTADATQAVEKLGDSARRGAGALGEMGGKAQDATDTLRTMTGLSATAAGGLGAVAAAAAVLGYAAFKGSQEQRQLNDAILLTGNHAGVVAGEIDRMAVRMASSIGGSVSASRQVLSGLVSSGRFTVDSLTEVATAVQLVARFSGQTNEKVLEHFAGMSDGVAKWAAKTNESYHFLSAAQYEYIKRLEDQGDKQAAMRVASEALSNHLGGDLTRNLGHLERAWFALQRAASDAWTAMKDVGKDETTQEIFARSSERLENARGGLAARSASGQDRLARLQTEKFDLFRRTEREGRGAGDRSGQQQAEQEAIKAVDDEAKFWGHYATKAQQRDKAIKEAVALAAKRNWTPQQLADAKARINERFSDRKTAADPNEQLIKASRERIAVMELEAQSSEQLTEAEKTRLKYLADVAAGYVKYNEVALQLLNRQVELEKASSARAEAEKRDARETKEAADEQARLVEAGEKNAARVEEEAQKLRMHTAELGLNKVAVAELEAAKLQDLASSKDRRAQLLEEAGLSGAQTETLRREAAAYRDLADAKRGAAAREAAVEAAKEQEKAWKESGDFIERILSESLRSGFDKGKSFWAGFLDSLRTTAKTSAITVGVRYVTQNVLGLPGGAGAGSAPAGLLGNLFGGGGLAGGGVSPFGSVLSNVGSAVGGLFGLGGAAASGASLAAGVGSGLGLSAAGAGTGLSLSAGIGSGLGLGAGTGAGLGLSAAGSGAAAGGAAAGGLMAGAAAAIPYVGIALAIGSMLSKGGETRSGATYRNGGVAHGPSGGQLNGAQAATQAAMTQINSLLGSMGSSARISDFLSALETSSKGKGFVYAGGTLSNGRSFGEFDEAIGRGNRRGSKSPEQAMAEYQEELKQATVQALQAADVPGLLGDYLRGLGEITLENAGAAYDKVVKALGERDQLRGRLDELTLSATQKLNRAREAERAAIDDTNRSLLAQVHAEEDLQRAKAGLLDAYSREGMQLREWAAQLREFRDGLMLGSGSPLQLRGKLDEAGRQFDQVLAASSKDPEARGRVMGQADAYLNAALAGATSREEYEAIFGKVTAALTSAAASADSQATVQEKQLKQLGLLNDKVATWAQAWAEYTAAKSKAAAAKAQVAADNASYVPPPPPAAAPAAAPAAPGGTWTNPDLHGAGAFATGGFHEGGLRIVGEGGPELEVTGPARIFSARETQDILRDASGDPQLATLLRDILSQLREQGSDQVRLDVKLLATMEAVDRRLKKLDLQGPEATWKVVTAEA